MRKSIKITLWTLLGLFVCFAGFVIYMFIFWGIGREKLHGAISPIPETQNAIPPITNGMSDWTRWRGPALNGKSATTGIRLDWSGGLRKRWEADFLSQGNRSISWSSPAVKGNRIIVPGRTDAEDLVFCLNADTGALIWKASYPAASESGHGTGARATPCIDGDRVYTYGRVGDLACWALLDGKPVWRKSVLDYGGDTLFWGHSSSPFVMDSIVVVQAGKDAAVIAFNKMTGDIVWKSKPGPASYASFNIMDYGGKPALLALIGSGLILLNPADGTEYASMEWMSALTDNITTPAIENDIAFITTGDGMGCGAARINDKTGIQLLWKNTAISSQQSDPVIIDGFVYGYSGMSNQNKGDFVCLELVTGKEQWRTNEIGWGTVLYVDGHLLCMDIKGNLYLVKPDPSRFIKVTAMPSALGDIRNTAWTIPVVANGTLYLRYMQRLVAYELTAEQTH